MSKENLLDYDSSIISEKLMECSNLTSSNLYNLKFDKVRLEDNY